MDHAAEISRDDLLSLLRPAGVTNAKLLRWHDVGLLPQPRRHGHGRNRRGSTSFYPRLVVLQAGILAQLLQRPGKRNLDEAGWDLWVMGFPVTDYVRDLLLEELSWSQWILRRENRRDRAGRSSVYSLAGARRPPRGTERMRKAIRLEALPRVLRMFASLQLGTLDQEAHEDKDWQLLLDAALAEGRPDLLDHPDLPEPSEAGRVFLRLSEEISIPATIKALRRIDPRMLDGYRSEAQWFFAQASQSMGETDLLLPRSNFLNYFRHRHVGRTGRQELLQHLRVLGWRRPPPTALQDYLETMVHSGSQRNSEEK